LGDHELRRRDRRRVDRARDPEIDRLASRWSALQHGDVRAKSTAGADDPRDVAKPEREKAHPPTRHELPDARSDLPGQVAIARTEATTLGLHVAVAGRVEEPVVAELKARHEERRLLGMTGRPPQRLVDRAGLDAAVRQHDARAGWDRRDGLLRSD